MLAAVEFASQTTRVSQGRAVVAIVASPGTRIDAWRDRFVGNDLRVLWTPRAPRGRVPSADEWVAPSEGALSKSLRAMPSVDCLLDVRTVGLARKAVLWSRAYFFVRNGGVYALTTARSWRTTAPPTDVRMLAERAGRRSGVGAFTERDVTELESATVDYEADRGLIRLRRRRTYAVSVVEREADDLLPRRFEKTRHEVLLTLPGEVFASPTVVDHHDPPRAPRRVETVLDVPPLSVREYEGDIRFHGHMAFSSEATVLPSSFRYPWARRSLHLRLPHQPYAAPANTAFRLRNAPAAARLPDADYVDLTHPFHGHFGHIIAQTVSRLWAMDAIGQVFPTAQYLLPEPTGARGRQPYEMVFAAGVPKDRVTWVARPVRLTRLIAPALGLQYAPTLFVHPAVVSTWRMLRDRLVTVDSSAPGKIFVSRRGGDGHRGCRNVGAVEETFAERGFAIIYPEDHSLRDQARLFGNARVIAGFGGSGMYNSLFADHLDAMIILNSERYTGRTEHLIALRIADRLDYFWNPTVVRDGADYQSPWRFDFARNGDRLRALLASV